MAKKKAKKKAASLAKKKATRPAPKKKAAAPKKKAGKKSGAAGKRAPAKEQASLGRPTVTADEQLYLLFKEDYHARQIFEFLRVHTVRELEQHNPREIIKRLSRPIEDSVDRIRRFLAERNRCLAGDEEFALAHKLRPLE